jgi:type II secretory pathway component GspD/PulD (secretin)
MVTTGICLLCLIAFGVEDSGAKEVAVIKVKYRTASDLLPIVKGMLNPKGSVTADVRTNSLIVVDSKDAIQRVQAYLNRFDQPTEQVRIHVRFDETSSAQDRSADIEARASGSNWSVGTDGATQDGVHGTIRDSDRRQSGTYGQYVITQSGVPAYIKTGQEIPYRENWVSLAGHHAAAHETITFKNIDTGFEVTPTVMGDKVNLKIVPRISSHESQTGAIRFHSAQTEIVVPFGQWVEFGGTSDQRNEVVREILSRGRGQGRSAMVMSLKVEKY